MYKYLGRGSVARETWKREMYVRSSVMILSQSLGLQNRGL